MLFINVNALMFIFDRGLTKNNIFLFLKFNVCHVHKGSILKHQTEKKLNQVLLHIFL